MLNIFKRSLAAIAAVATLAGFSATGAEAQNWRLNPSYGSFNLTNGFTPDPQYLTGRAGGDIHVNPLSGCPGGGWFANAPDFRIFYQAGGYPLTFYTRAPGGQDVMLLINDPNGNWYCNDDTDGLDAAIRFGRPSSGQYDAWIGTYNRSRVRNTRLYVTELR